MPKLQKYESAQYPMPPLACDCHMHVFGRPDRYPPAATRSYTPREAPLAVWRDVAEALGLERVVVVQPTSTDTALWRDALETVQQTESGLSDEQRTLYAKHIAGARRLTRMIQRQTMPAERVAATIERALTDERPRARYPVGAATKAQLALFAISPTRLKDTLLGRASGIPRKLAG